MLLKTYHFQWTEIIIDSDLPALSKYLCLYLATFMNGKQNLAWPSQARMVSDTGLTKPTIIKYLDIADESGLLVTERTDDHKSNNKYHAKIPETLLKVVNEVNKSGELESLGVVKEIDHPSKGGLLGVVKDVNPNKQLNKQVNKPLTDKHMCFTAPTPDEVNSYAREKGITLNAEDFCDFYESKGWMVGKNKMKNWKSSANLWSRSNSNRGNSNGNNGNRKFSVGAYVAQQLRECEEEENSQNIRNIN